MAVGAVGLGSWLAAARFFHHGYLGLLIAGGMVFYLWGLIDEDFDGVFTHALVAFTAMVPLVYCLVLLLWLGLLLSGLAHFTPAKFFGTSLLGALVGSGGRVLAGLNGALKAAADSSNPGKRQVDADEHFLGTLSLRIPFAFAIAGLFGLPERLPALAVVGASWGLVATISVILEAVLVDHKTVRSAGGMVGWSEFVLVMCLLIAVLTNLFPFHPATMVKAAALLTAAMAACALAYLLALAGAAVVPLARARRAALTPRQVAVLAGGPTDASLSSARQPARAATIALAALAAYGLALLAQLALVLSGALRLGVAAFFLTSVPSVLLGGVAALAASLPDEPAWLAADRRRADLRPSAVVAATPPPALPAED